MLFFYEVIMYLSNMETGQKARVIALDADDNISRRLLDIGLTSGANIECVGKSPCGDPKAFLIRGAVVAIRSEDAKKVRVHGVN